MPGTEVGSLYYDLNIDDKNLRKQLDNADNSVKSFGDRVNRYWGDSVDASRKFGLALAGVTAGVVAFGISSVKSFEESQNVMAQTEAVLKSTGNAAGITAKQVTDLATALERQTKFADEDVQKVENLLLTFTAIGKDIFPQATKTVLDMATALGEDTSSASIQLGKALQDPILGVTALRRVGVNFNAAQQEVIANLVNTGRQAEAQKMILAELNKEFGGSAKAAGDTFAGQLAKLKNQLDNVKEAIGKLLIAVGLPFVTAIMNWFYAIGGVDGVLKGLKDTFEKIQPYLPVIAGAILGIMVPALVAAAAAAVIFIATLAPWAALGAGVVILAQQLGIGWDDVGRILGNLKPVWDDLKKAFDKIRDVSKEAADKLQELYEKFIQLKPVKDTLDRINDAYDLFKQRLDGVYYGAKNVNDVIKITLGLFAQLWQWFTNLTIVQIIAQYISQVLWPALAAIAAAIWQNLLPAFEQLWGSIVRLWNALNPALMDALKVIAAIIFGALLLAIWLILSALNILIQVFAMVVSAISIAISWIANLIGWFGNLVGTVWNIINTIASILWNLPKAFNDVVGVMFSIAAGIGGGILRAIGALGSLLYQAGRDLIQGMINGITDKFRELAGAVKNAVSNAVGAVKGFLGIHSPSKVFHEIGNNVTQGFINGINDSAGMAVKAMGSFSDAIIAPQMTVNPAAAGGAGTSTTHRYGDTNINIGTINDTQDADYLLARVDTNQRLQQRGVAPR
jgi:phage-related protein